jgi:hypothetical protein
VADRPVIDTVFDAVLDAVLEETGTREQRLRLLPSRVVVYFVLALALFEDCSYRGVWGKLVAGVEELPLVRPAISSLSWARRRIGAAPLRLLFETLAGPVARPGQTGAFYRGLRTVAVDGTLLHTPDDEVLTWRYRKRVGEAVEFGYPLLRLLVLVECGTRAVLAAAFGPESDGELTYASRLLYALNVCRSKIRFSAVSCSDTGWSSSAVVLVDQAAEYGVSSDPVGFKVGDGCCGRRPGGLRRQLLPGLVGAMPVVVLDVCGEHGMGVGFVEDQDPIEKLAP